MKQPCTSPTTAGKVSFHGGHSGEFCLHARDTLRAVVNAYIGQGFTRIGLTEHMPPVSDAHRYRDEVEAGLSAAFLQARFGQYIDAARGLQREERGRIRIHVAFETEYYPGALESVEALVQRYRPDYLVGSVHHVDAINFDYDPATYAAAVSAAGGIDALYERYFDHQFLLLERVCPGVVGHFDLVRVFDPDYRQRLERPSIRARILRNLDLMAAEGLIMDLNTRALKKGAHEPYPSRRILEAAQERGIAVVPGDDAHAAADAGSGHDAALALIRELDLSTAWPDPRPPRTVARP